ncbi:MAG: hypothetical protein WBC91_11575 [Phototrophicaceae bacterium]
MSDNMLEKVTQYNELVHQYHALDEDIDSLLEHHQGHSENMTDEARTTYRQLARQRDDILNQMREMEQTLFSE